jgi:hypothetical protein
MGSFNVKVPSPFRCYLIIASMIGQQKGPSQGGINGLKWVTRAVLEIGYFEENK